ncbi:MAG: ferritin [Deltaproteobacteria bacterium]|nr:ferritin [Deltaproteobacteria bacterium]
MAISEAVLARLNDQLHAEFDSAYLYLAMAASLSRQNLPGCATWMRIQAHEETLHAVKLYDFILARDGLVVLKTVDAQTNKWSSVLEVFQQALDHEQRQTQRLNELSDFAVSEKDHATQSLLRWFVDEQVEEEATLGEVIQKLKLVGNSGPGLYMFDQEMGRRPPAALQTA